MKRQNKQLVYTAYHEAGHAVVAYFLGVKLHKSSIVRKGETLGYVKHQKLLNKSMEWDTSTRNRIRMENAVITALAGFHAEKKFNPKARSHQSKSDFDCANAINYFIGSQEQAEAYFRYLNVTSKDKVNQYWKFIVAFAKELLKQQTMSGEEATNFIKERLQNERGSIHKAK